MSSRAKYGTVGLLLRSIEPSAISLFFCIAMAFGLVAINVVLQSVSAGTALPGLLDGQWSIAYTQNVVQPLTEFLNSNTLNKFLVALLWGVAGFLVYVGFEYVLHISKSLRESQESIRIARGNVIERPLMASFWQGAAWRAGVLIGGIIFLVLVQPLLRHALGVAPTVLLNPDLLHNAFLVLAAIAEWTFVLHGLVVFLRLYTQRTRIFGDDELY